MNFNPDADLDTSNIEWLGYRPIISNWSKMRFLTDSPSPTPTGTNAMWDFLTTYVQVAFLALLVFTVLAFVANRIDSRSRSYF